MVEVIPIYIEDEMKRSYIDYAMSVIVGRALPDIRDGLKPVHRRILYAMKELGLTHNRAFRKSASVVGEVLGKYHPHGDSSVYDALVRMVQSFSLRYPLAIGQGNFGSIDGDAAAAYRYTETKLSEIAEFMLKDIEKGVVPLVPNFDGRMKEPSVLPSEFPNLLVNGSSGIAVGMATNIPPHNLAEVIDALIALIENSELEDFSPYIKGPDFPTGGVIVGEEAIKKAYQTGRGKITVKGRVHIEELKNGRERICITEIPYQVNKSMLISEIVEHVKNKKIEGISDIRDESDREGMRIVLDLKPNAPSQVILNRLFKHTALMTTYGVNLVALKDGVPKLLTLKELLTSFLEHRYQVVKKRTEFDLKEAEKKAHILEGLKIALLHIDEVVKIIRHAKDEKEAKEKLQAQFKLSDSQVKAILDMRLAKLVGLEQEKINKEYLETIKLIEKLKRISASREGIMGVVKEELIQIRNKFGDKRRTKISKEEIQELEIEDLIPNVPTLITFTEKGYIKRSKPESYPRQLRGGKGVTGITLVPEDKVIKVFETLAHSILIMLTPQGRCYSIKGYIVPEVDRSARGKPVTNFISLGEGERIKEVLPIEKGSVVIVTKKGIIKKLKYSRFEKIRTTGIIAISLREGDEVVAACEVKPNDWIFIITKKGKVIRFSEQRLRLLSRTAEGVRGIKLADDDEVISIKATSNPDDSLFFITPDGWGKRVSLGQFRITNRGGVGIIGSKVKIGGCEIVREESEIIFITIQGKTLRTRANSIRKMGRVARGVKIVNLGENDRITNVCKIDLKLLAEKTK
jgi:DNA gyrase subunit A